MSEVRELTIMPSLGPLIAKALVPSFHRPTARIPSHTLRFRGLAQHLDRLADYDRVCGFTVRDVVSPTWLHVLTFPLHVQLLSDPDSTIRLAGVVHVSNRMRLHRPVTAAETLDLSVQARNLRPHLRGALLDLVGEVRVGEELVWEGLSTYLAPGASIEGEPERSERVAFEPIAPIARWQLPADLGRQYRRVSGDPNPIHTHLLAAKGLETNLWVFEEDLCETIRKTGENNIYLPGFRLTHNHHCLFSFQHFVNFILPIGINT